MGMKLTKAQEKLFPRRPPSGFPVEGIVTGWIPMEPPTVTHHDKRPGRRHNGALGIFDTAALRRARAAYGQLVPPRRGPPLLGPVLLELLFVWPDPTLSRPVWRKAKPDADNAAKTFQDALTKAGWFADDAEVATLVVRKVNVPVGHRVGIAVTAISLPDDTEVDARYRGPAYADGLRFEPFPVLI